MTLKIDSEGRVTLPQAALDDLNVGPGDKLEFEVIGESVKLLRRESNLHQIETPRD